MREKSKNDYMHFALTDIPIPRRQKTWKDKLNEFFYEYDFHLPTDFMNGEIEGCHIGNISIARVKSDAMAVHRMARHISRDALDAYFVLLPTADPLLLEQRGRQAVIRDKQFSLVSTSDTYFYAQNTHTLFNNLIIPGQILRQHAPHVDDLVARASQDRTLCRMFTDFANALCTGLHDLEVHERETVSRQAVELLGLVLDGADSASSATSIQFAHRRRIVRLIEQEYTNPAFDIDAISKTLKLSKRYIQAIFAANGETVTEVVRRRRVAEAQRLLAHRRASRATVTEIAHSIGFTSLAHFSRVFKMETGSAPTDVTGTGAGDPGKRPL